MTKNKEFSYTPQQEEAICDRGNNLLVSAAAGSGKTLVLVDRIIKLMLEDEKDIEDFLIVTFTNAAANQMAEKIRKKLIESLGQGKDKFIRRQLQNLAKANISTMHSFCIKLVREYYEYLGISPTFAIANQTNGAVLSLEAMEMTLEEEYQESRDDFTRLFSAYSNGNEDNLAEIIIGLHFAIQSQINPLEWLEDIVEKDFNIKAHICQLIDHECLNAIKLFESGLELANEPDGPFKYTENFNDDIGQLEELRSIAQAEDYTKLHKSLQDIKFSRLKTISKKDIENGVSESKKELAKSLRNQGKKYFEKEVKEAFKNKSPEQIAYEKEEEGAYLRTLARLVRSYDENLRLLKDEENLLSFSDVEHLSLKLLSDPLIAERISSKISYIFYDEYQDINPIQEEIINRIKGRDNLFFVGDIKQSIYKFRLADPRMFNRRYELYKEGQGGKLINLSDNFRSSPVILKFLNFIFKDLMSKDLGEVDYRARGQALSWLDSAQDKKGKLTIVINEEKKDKPYLALEENPSYIAQEIKTLVTEGYEYKDIVVLLRNMKNRVENYEDAFDYYGIPYYSDYSNISLEDPEVSIVIDFLKVINNFRNDNALISVLLTPIGKMDENDLAEIRSRAKDQSFYDALISYDKANELAVKIDNFIKLVESYRQDMMRMTLADFVYHILSDSGYLAYIGASYRGEEKLENIFAFIDRVMEYEESSQPSLVAFLKYVDRLLDAPSESLEPSKLLSENDNLVRIMTIHKSKGLEFPVVFMSDMEREIQLLEKRNKFIVDDELGVGVRLHDLNRETSYKTAHRKLIEYKKEKENLSEEMRLLYVGATRAEERLYLVGSHQTPGKYIEQKSREEKSLAIDKARSMMDWYMACLVRDKAFVDGLEGLEIERPSSDYFENKEDYKLLIMPYKDQIKDPDSLIDLSILEEADISEEMFELDRILNYSYPNQALTKKAFKNTVSEISQKNIFKTDDTTDFPKRFIYKSPVLEKIPNLLKKDASLASLTMGSLVHFIFQNISYQDHDLASIEDELERLLSMELISREEKNLLDPNVFLNFFKTRLAKRAINNLSSLEREKSFTMKVDDMYIDGQVDAFFVEDGELVLFDFKTDKSIAEDRYKVQMSYYKEALERAYRMKVKEIYIYWTSFAREMLIYP